MLSRVTAKNVEDVFFLRHSVYTAGCRPLRLPRVKHTSIGLRAHSVEQSDTCCEW